MIFERCDFINFLASRLLLFLASRVKWLPEKKKGRRATWVSLVKSFSLRKAVKIAKYAYRSLNKSKTLLQQTGIWGFSGSQ